MASVDTTVRLRAAEDTSGEDLVRLYLREIGRHPLLAADQEIEMAKAIEAGTQAATRLERSIDGNGSLSARTRDALERQVDVGERARRRFIEANLRLVVSIARRYQGFGLPLLDLIQDGNIGLLRAVEKYDWRRGFKFSTYATWWVRQGISRGLADRARTIRLPVHIAEIINRLRRTEADLSSVLGREPTDHELAEALDLDIDELRTYRTTAMDTVSLSAPLGEDGDAELHEFIADDAADEPLEEAVRTRSADELREILDTLSPREKRVLELRFGLFDGRERTLEQVGKEFNLTRERIRQIESKAIAKLRHPARRGDLEAMWD
ncbi:MAG: sigma-70 family RNA polymerase sigma factor [Actinomycetota bacterium]